MTKKRIERKREKSKKKILRQIVHMLLLLRVLFSLLCVSEAHGIYYFETVPGDKKT